MVALKRLIMIGTFILCVCGLAQGEIIDRVVAIINGDVITMSELEHEARGRLKQSGQTPSPDFYRELLSVIIEQRLILREAAQAHVAAGDREIDQAIERVTKQNNITVDQLKQALQEQGLTWAEYRKQIRDDIIRNQIIGMKVQSQVSVTDKDYAEYLEGRQSEHVESPKVKIEQLSFPLPEGAGQDARDQSAQKAEAAHQRVNSGADFRTVAEELGLIKAGESVDFGYFSKGELVGALDEAAFSLPVGSVSNVIETGRGFFIIRVVDRKEAGSRSVDEVKDEVREQIFRAKAEKKYREWIEELYANAYIEVKL